MKIIDNNGRLFGKISIIDLLVIAVVAVMAVALYVRSTALTVTAAPSADQVITFTFKSETVKLHVADALAVGDYLYDTDHSTGGPIGIITSIERLPGDRVVYLDNGTYERVPNPNSCNLLITVECKGIVTDGNYAINRIYKLGVNANRNFYTPYAAVSGVVQEIG